MILNFGKYGFFKTQVLNIEGKIGARRFITTDANFLQEGFIECGNITYCYPIQENTGVRAYYVETFCTYKNLKFQVLNILKDGKLRIAPLDEAQMALKDVSRHGYDPIYEVPEIEIEEIWEERKPIEGFIFDVEPIYYTKNKI